MIQAVVSVAGMMPPQAVDTPETDPRIPVWVALSDLYLDTDVTLSYDHIARTLAASPFSIEALEEILNHEVHPALHRNLMIPAGEWAYFDEAFVVESVRRVCRQPLWRRKLSRFFVPWLRKEWQALVPMIETLRASAAHRASISPSAE